MLHMPSQPSYKPIIDFSGRGLGYKEITITGLQHSQRNVDACSHPQHSDTGHVAGNMPLTDSPCHTFSSGFFFLYTRFSSTAYAG